MVNATAMTYDEQAALLRTMRDVARKEAEMYAAELGGRTPILVTTVKPEGTLSQLPIVSSGVHYSHAPYYIRRVRINAHDPLVQVCEELGYPVFPEVGQEMETCTTKVVEFPVKAPEGKTKYDVTAIEQLENYKLFMENYVDHNCSITVHVRPDEWEAVEEWVDQYWDDIVALSFLPLDDSFYQMLPYEQISEAEYEERAAAMKPFRPSLITKYEKEEVEFDVGVDGCETGACPVR
jgi:ribonucleoside-diphosphate reductase alpha chain/ribonucleoside-triphosphate reductase